MSDDLVSRLPAAVVVAKKNRETFEEIGVTPVKVFSVVKRAMNAMRTPVVQKRREKPSPDQEGRLVKREPDWNTRLRAVEIWMELTSVTPSGVHRTMQGARVDISPGDEIVSLHRERGTVENAKRAIDGRAIPAGLPDMEAPPITMPPKRETLAEVIARREREQTERETIEAIPRAQRFKPTTTLEMDDVA